VRNARATRGPVLRRPRTFEYSIAADLFAAERAYLGVNWYDTIVVTPDRGRLRGVGGVEVRADAPFEAIARASTIVIPGWRDVTATPPECLFEALRAAAKRRLLVRWEYYASNFLGFVQLASVTILLKRI
jgi:transcriptional regulator GlxA family with amidase domain